MRSSRLSTCSTFTEAVSTHSGVGDGPRDLPLAAGADSGEHGGGRGLGGQGGGGVGGDGHMDASRSSSLSASVGRRPSIRGPASRCTVLDNESCEDLKRHQRRDDRAQQSQAFRAWLKRQRAVAAADRQFTSTDDVVAVMGSSAGREGAGAAPLQDCGSRAVAAEQGKAASPSQRFEQQHQQSHPRCSASQLPQASPGGAPLVSFSPRNASREVRGLSPHSPKSPIDFSRGFLAGAGAPHVGGSSHADNLDWSEHSVLSIGDRIEGIRACLEARMGTQRFQKLYHALSVGDADSAGGPAGDFAMEWPRESSMFLPDEIDEAFDGAGEGKSADLDALAPLVAKLVACESSYFS